MLWLGIAVVYLFVGCYLSYLLVKELNTKFKYLSNRKKLYYVVIVPLVSPIAVTLNKLGIL